MIEKTPRGVNAGLANIDYSTTARLGARGVEMVYEQSLLKQQEDKLDYKQMQIDQKTSQIADGQIDALVEANPEVLDFLQSSQGDTYKKFTDGRASLTDKQALLGGATTYEASVQAQQDREVRQLALDAERNKIANKTIAKEQLSTGFVTTTDEDGNETTSFDLNTYVENVANVNPSAIAEATALAQPISLTQAEIELKTAQGQADILNAQAKVLTAKVNLAKTEGTKEANINYNRIQMYATNENKLGRKMDTDQLIGTMASYGLPTNTTESKTFIENLEKADVITSEDKKALIKKQEEDAEFERIAISNKFAGLGFLNTSTEEILRYTSGGRQDIGNKYGTGVREFGLLSDVFSMRFSTKSEAIAGLFNTLISSNVIDQMLKLKAESPTGSTGFGAMNQSELDLLKNAQVAIGNAQRTSPEIAGELVAQFQYANNRLMFKMYEQYRYENNLSEKEALANLNINPEAIGYARQIMTEYEKTAKGIDIVRSMGSGLTIMRPEEKSIPTTNDARPNAFNPNSKQDQSNFYSGGYTLIGVKSGGN